MYWAIGYVPGHPQGETSLRVWVWVWKISQNTWFPPFPRYHRFLWILLIPIQNFTFSRYHRSGRLSPFNVVSSLYTSLLQCGHIIYSIGTLWAIDVCQYWNTALIEHRFVLLSIEHFVLVTLGHCPNHIRTDRLLNWIHCTCRNIDRMLYNIYEAEKLTYYFIWCSSDVGLCPGSLIMGGTKPCHQGLRSFAKDASQYAGFTPC